MPSDRPLVSILIPMYNAEEWIAATIESALAQTWSHTEVIVVDDGSTDESLSIARSIDAPELTVVSQENQGACTARNQAFELSKGEYIQYLDADDLLPPNKIEAQIQRLEREPPRTVASCRWGVFETDPSNSVFENENHTWQDFEDPIEWYVTWAGGKGGPRPHTWLTPRVLIEEAGPWIEDLRINQDGEFFSRVLPRADGIAYCPETEVYYRLGEGVSSRRDREAWKSQYRATELICSHLRSVEDSQKTRQICVTLYHRFVRNAYPQVRYLVAQAEEEISRYEEDSLLRTCFSDNPVLNLISRLAGWKTARLLQYIYRQYIRPDR